MFSIPKDELNCDGSDSITRETLYRNVNDLRHIVIEDGVVFVEQPSGSLLYRGVICF